MAITLHNQWKIPLSQSNYAPAVTLVSLYDLLFYETKSGIINTRYFREANQSYYTSKGLELKHNVIVFDTEMYQLPQNATGRRVITKFEPIMGGTTFEDWEKGGFDISLPKFDKKVKPLFLTESNVHKYVKSVAPNSDEMLKFLNGYNPAPLATNDYYNNGQPAGRAAGVKVWDKDAALKPLTSADCYLNSVLYREIQIQDDWDYYPDPWTVGCEEDYRQHTENADIILSSRDDAFEERFLEGERYHAYNGICLNYTSSKVWRNFLKYYNFEEKEHVMYNQFVSVAADSLTVIQFADPIVEYLLKHCFVWIKCSFFADYIDHRDFDQSLNKSANVIHENLMLTKTGNFRRYEELFSEQPNAISNREQISTFRPYLPSTTPSKDRVRDILLFNRAPNLQNGMREIIEDANDPESTIGALPVEPLERTYDELKTPPFTSQALNSPPQIWFDPESRKEPNDYQDYPILVPKEGNLIMNGRILSPTIDELWQMVKEMVAGRKPDNEPAVGDIGYPRGTGQRETRVDTRPSIRDHLFQSGDGTSATYRGDPTLIDYDIDNPELPSYKVMSWVNNPSSIEYNIISELVNLNTELCNGAEPNTVLESITNLDRALYEDYAPESQPWSLREIEAQLKGLRWNLSQYIWWQHYNGVYNGLIGRSNTDTRPVNDAAGSLYQLHKDYDARNFFNRPNTVYDERAHSTGLPYGIGLGEIKDDMTTDDKDVVPSWSVYLGADGQWHSSKQSCLIPVRNETF